MGEQGEKERGQPVKLSVDDAQRSPKKDQAIVCM